jgi:hypothetical protein
MKISKLSIQTTALVSGAVFLFHLGILCTSLVKLNPKVWSIYKFHGEALDFFFFGVYCFTFILALGVWFLADAPLSRRFLYSGVLFPVYFVISFIACIIVCHIYAVAVGGY